MDRLCSDREGTQDIYRMDVDGSNLIRLTDQGLSGKPAWSPDSQSLAFDSQQEILPEKAWIFHN